MKENVVAGCACLSPIDRAGLEALIKSGKENPEVIKTLKCKTIAVGKFRHENYIRNLPAYIVDEPPVLLGDDTAPNPSEVVLAALGSCICVGIHANAIAQNITISKLEIELEGDLNITAVWGTGDLSKNKPLGFTELRIKVDLQSDADEKTKEALIEHATKYSPVANTMIRHVKVEVDDKEFKGL
ncbi:MULTISPECIES: OsmC family protein [unclassified Campylobacter]|uniref:OsmC family protein n=1 Tax=unclassified Campylobacter TaxID=2593542 RepID=UPI001237F91F|nr:MULTISPECIES: OsmC family protein [unclassified Campylobacter]KAA6225632.1 OsmC family protein [Campylobacter sp. LR185c]KAA6228543.1 OsmC family protein [Campylobacter sp. LR286c]KAA6230933.1 OsmC family protein [Campylobacter sp. LR291e]KAA8603852.1 peroxiredoxin [Campylobacter sp. LR185c]